MSSTAWIHVDVIVGLWTGGLSLAEGEKRAAKRKVSPIAVNTYCI